jgi:hypothetical protein
MITVLGTSHRLQGARREDNVDDPSYRRLVEKLISEELIDYVFEEACGLGPTIASVVAKEKSAPNSQLSTLNSQPLPTQSYEYYVRTITN